MRPSAIVRSRLFSRDGAIHDSEIADASPTFSQAYGASSRWCEPIRKEPAPITFEKTLTSLSEQLLELPRATIPMHAKDWQPTAAPAKP